MQIGCGICACPPHPRNESSWRCPGWNCRGVCSSSTSTWRRGVPSCCLALPSNHRLDFDDGRNWIPRTMVQQYLRHSYSGSAWSTITEASRFSLWTCVSSKCTRADVAGSTAPACKLAETRCSRAKLRNSEIRFYMGRVERICTPVRNFVMNLSNAQRVVIFRCTLPSVPVGLRTANDLTISECFLRCGVDFARVASPGKLASSLGSCSD